MSSLISFTAALDTTNSLTKHMIWRIWLKNSTSAGIFYIRKIAQMYHWAINIDAVFIKYYFILQLSSISNSHTGTDSLNIYRVRVKIKYRSKFKSNVQTVLIIGPYPGCSTILISEAPCYYYQNMTLIISLRWRYLLSLINSWKYWFIDFTRFL